MRWLAFACCWSIAACGGGQPAARSIGLGVEEQLAASVAIVRSGCARCHEFDAAAQARFAPAPAHAPLPLHDAAAWWRHDGGREFLRRHATAGEATDDLAAYVQHLGRAAPVAEGIEAGPVAQVRGEALFRELACAACHSPGFQAQLPQRVDFGRLQRFLRAPQERHPGRAHPRLAEDEATAIAAWLLRAQVRDAVPTPGFVWTCRELQVTQAGLPDLEAAPIVARGVAGSIEAGVGTRAHHFVLEFTATLDVPTAGDWTFVVGSDDSSWLWIDDELVVRNEALAPHRRRDGTRRLREGPHALRVVFAQAEGGASLEVLWRGPGQELAPLPKDRARAERTLHTPPPIGAAPDAAAVVRGRAKARTLRCDACHAIDDPEFAALPPPERARPWSQLRPGPCPHHPGGEALLIAGRGAVELPDSPASRLHVGLLRDGCLSCHARDGRGGLPAPVRQQLRDVEDLGDEGRLPPDLTGVGRRLRPEWLARTIAEGHDSRSYVRVRMPAFGEAKGREYAAWFAAVDGRPGDAGEPSFSAAAVERGRQLVGTTGKNCITCHVVGSHRALGPQGMDLLQQHERLQPAWFRDWLLEPQRHRPGTRMPPLWPTVDEAARADADAIRSWASLGAAAPLPDGLSKPGGLQLVPTDRPVLHGAFLQGLSARCLAVGTSERTHFAWELGGARLAWLWRGDFLDASGTWSGRAGQLLAPAGTDHVVLEDLVLGDGGTRTLRGQRRTADGYPVLEVDVDGARYEDEVRPRLVASGSEIVRTLRCTEGVLRVRLPAPGDGVQIVVAGGAEHRLAAGQSLELVYRWSSR